MSDYGPTFADAVHRLKVEIGNEAAGLIDIGQPPDNAIKLATIRVKARRETAARQRQRDLSHENVVLLQDIRSRGVNE